MCVSQKREKCIVRETPKKDVNSRRVLMFFSVFVLSARNAQSRSGDLSLAVAFRRFGFHELGFVLKVEIQY